MRKIVFPRSRKLEITSQAARRADGIKTRSRLVKEQQVRIADQRQRNIQAPTLTTGKLRAPHRGAIDQTDQAERLMDRTGLRVVAGVKRHALLDREFRLRLRLLQHNTDAGTPCTPGAGRVFTKNRNLAR